MISRPKPEDKMVEVSKKTRAMNQATVDYQALHGTHVRIEHNRHTDLPLVTMCLRKVTPEHVRQVHKGVFAVDLPADVHKIVWFTSDGYSVGTYRNKLDRAEAL